MSSKKPTKNLSIKGFTSKVDMKRILEKLDTYGDIISVNLSTGAVEKNKCFVKFADLQEAIEAYEENKDGIKIGDDLCTIEYVKRNNPQSIVRKVVSETKGYVSGFDPATSVDELRRILNSETVIFPKRKPGQTDDSTFFFVYYNNPLDLRDNIRRLNGAVINGKKVTMRRAHYAERINNKFKKPQNKDKENTAEE